MHVITVGSIIERARKEQKAISQKTLIQGICSIQTLYAIDTNQYKTNILLVDSVAASRKIARQTGDHPLAGGIPACPPAGSHRRSNPPEQESET